VSAALALPGAPARAVRPRSALPGLRPALALTSVWLLSIVVLPLAALAIRPLELGPAGLFASLAQPRVFAALRLSFGTAALAALIDLPAGFLLAWVLTRQRFTGRRLLDSLVDLPFALPTAVAGITLVTLFGPNGLLGAPLAAAGLRVAYTPTGILVALVFVGIPFVVRTVEPVLRDLPRELEEAAHTLGATPAQTLRRVLLPPLFPAFLVAWGLAFARGVGEYGSVIFIAGNMPMTSEIAPLLIVTRLQQFDYAGAAAIGFAMLVGSLGVLSLLAFLQRRLEAR
jgi:sulfate/thiosulfate transport system permease protein